MQNRNGWFEIEFGFQTHINIELYNNNNDNDKNNNNNNNNDNIIMKIIIYQSISQANSGISVSRAMQRP